MKKLLTCILAAVLMLACLTACDLFAQKEHTYKYIVFEQGHYKKYTCGCCQSPQVEEEHCDNDGDHLCDVCGYEIPEHDQHTGKWYTSESTHYYQYTCGCPSPDIAELHTDYDENYICDICGYVMAGHEHTYQNYQDEIGHGWSYTCGCMTPPNFAQHADGDGDGKCDDCKYYMLKEGNHFIRNQAGCEWLNEITAEDIAEIKIIGEAVGVAPGNLKNVSSSTVETVIARIFEEYYQLDTRPISKMEGQIDGGSGVTVKFILKDGTERKLYINNGNYRDPDGNYFELLSTPKFKDTDTATKAYGFITYLGAGMVYDKDNNPVCEIPIDELEFIITDYDPMLFANGYEYYINTEFGTLYFAKVEIFASDELSDELVGADYYFIEEGNTEFCYRLVGKKLDELIDKYTPHDGVS